MQVLRTLESLGAAVMREGVYLLPDTPANRQSLEPLADYIAKVHGAASVLQVNAASPEQQAAFKRLFDRSARYDDLIKTVQSLRVGYGQSDPSAISRVVHKQRREFEAIAALDFFPSAARSAPERRSRPRRRRCAGSLPGARAARARAGRGAARAHLGDAQALWADRLACSWLIRRFVDPEATLTWLEKSRGAAGDSIAFGFEGAHFGNSPTRVTFEEMLVKLDLGRNPALAKIGSIVHFLEIRGTPVAEAAGVQTLLQGAQRRSNSEKELLAEAEKTFDLLYEAYYQPPKTSVLG